MDITCDGLPASLDDLVPVDVQPGIDLDMCHQSAADMNGDGNIDGLDVQAWLDIAVAV